MKMRKRSILILVFLLSFFCVSSVFARNGIYLGLQGGFTAQKPSLKSVEFNTDTTFLYGVRAGVRFMMVALELNYFQASHNLKLADVLSFKWEEREIDYNYIGANFKIFFPMMAVHPYLTIGYGNYTADIKDVDDDKSKGFNFGVGVEIMLGDRFSILAEGKYQSVDFLIDEEKLDIDNYTIVGGVSFYF